jgi:hypothetical protein
LSSPLYLGFLGRNAQAVRRLRSLPYCNGLILIKTASHNCVIRTLFVQDTSSLKRAIANSTIRFATSFRLLADARHRRDPARLRRMFSLGRFGLATVPDNFHELNDRLAHVAVGDLGKKLQKLQCQRLRQQV